MKTVCTFIFMALAVSQKASAQEPAGHTDFKKVPADSMPALFLQEIPYKKYSLSPTVDLGYEPFDASKYAGFSGKYDSTAISERLRFKPLPYIPAARYTPAAHHPFANDFSSSGVLTSWKEGALIGGSSRETMPGLLSVQNASLGVMQNAGRFTFTAGVTADRYLLMKGVRTSFGVNGSMTYNFSDNVSATIFGRYYTNQRYYSMAAMPYMGSSAYGGYLTLMGERLGVDLGVERVYDPYSMRWVTSPIITPKIKIGEKFMLDLPVGWLVKSIIEEKVFKKGSNAGPTIMPMKPDLPGPIPFAPPEIPRGR